MIRVIQRRLIIPRGDTGVFTIPAMTQAEGAIGVFTIFDPITNTRIFQKQVEIEGENFDISFSHADTVNLKAGEYLWDIKFYKNPILADNKVIDGEEINSYYAAFQAPKCEIRETGDDFLMIEGQPAKIEDLNIILAATEAANAAKVAATEQAEEAAARLAEMVAVIPTKVSELENDSGYLQQETDPTVPAWAKAQTKPTYTAQEVGALPANTFIPSKVSDLTDDSGHYTKPATGIPASDLEETYVKFDDYATDITAGVVKVNKSYGLQVTPNGTIIPLMATDEIIKQGNTAYYSIGAGKQHQATFYGLAKAAGDTTQSQSSNAVGVYTDEAKAAIQQMLDVPSTADIPTNVSAFTNDAGYLTQHQDISGKANAADLAAVATSGSYEDLSDKPTIPEVPVQDVQINGNSILENNIASIPLANVINLGLVKSGSGEGISIDASGVLKIATPSTSELKALSNKKAIVLNTAHRAVFYGLAKAAGADEKDSTLPVGEYTDTAKSAIRTMLGAASDNIIAISDTAPTDPDTKIWIHETATSVQVPTVSEMESALAGKVGDIQIDGTSIVSNGVANIPVASTTDAGVVKVSLNNGTQMINGVVTTVNASDAEIKAGLSGYKMLSATKQHQAVFYGLAKAAGDATQAASDNAVGTYTDDAKAAIKSMIGVNVDDVQVNGTSIVSGGVANVPLANATTLGVATFGLGLAVDNVNVRRVYVSQAYEVDCKNGSANFKEISPGIQHAAAFYGLAKAAGDTTQSASSNAVGTYTDNAKASIKAMLGIQDGSTGTVDVTGTTPTITAIENTRYVCGEVTSLSFTPPASGISIVRFTSGSTVTVLTIPSTVKFPEWFDPTSLETNTIYEICVTDGEFGAVMSWPL